LKLFFRVYSFLVQMALLFLVIMAQQILAIENMKEMVLLKIKIIFQL